LEECQGLFLCQSPVNDYRNLLFFQNLDEAAAALDIKLSEEDMKFLKELYQPHPTLEH